MPVRKVSNRGGNIVGRFPSLKMRRMIAFESLLERDFIYLLDYEAQVEQFEEQPLTIEYQYEDQTLHYTPDFHLIEAGHPILVECKPDRFVDTEENCRKFAAARAWCDQHGREFRVVTDRQLRAGWRLRNVQRLTAYARLKVAAELSSRIVACVREATTTLTLQTVAQTIQPDDPHPIIASLLHLSFHHVLELPLDTAPLSGASLVSWRAPLDQRVKP